jgi:hypothetical protein
MIEIYEKQGLIILLFFFIALGASNPISFYIGNIGVMKY